MTGILYLNSEKAKTKTTREIKMKGVPWLIIMMMFEISN